MRKVKYFLIGLVFIITLPLLLSYQFLAWLLVKIATLGQHVLEQLLENKK